MPKLLILERDKREITTSPGVFYLSNCHWNIKLDLKTVLNKYELLYQFRKNELKESVSSLGVG